MYSEFQSAIADLAVFNAGHGPDSDGVAIFNRIYDLERRAAATPAKDLHERALKLTMIRRIAAEEHNEGSQRRDGMLLALVDSMQTIFAPRAWDPFAASVEIHPATGTGWPAP